MIRKIAVAIVFSITYTTHINAAILREGATVESVELSWFGSELIIVYMNGGTGFCSNGNIILSKRYFDRWEGHFDRSYSMLMTALLSGKSVDIHGAEGDCISGSLVTIHR